MAPDFVGRTEELGSLRSALEATEAGRSTVVVLHGEAGVGKTRTVEEFAEQARASGTQVLWGACYERESPFPLSPWGEAIDGGLEGLDREQRDQLVGPDAAVLSALSPRIDRPAPNGSPVSGVPDVLSLSAAVARFLDTAGSFPVLVLDDLQWAAPASLDLFCYVARSPAKAMIVAVYRGRELDISYPLARCLGEVNRSRPCEYIRLTGLLRPDANALLKEVSRPALEPQAATAIYDASDGNPFYLLTLGRSLAAGGAPGDLDWHPPEPIRQSVAVRLADLAIPARHIVERASILTMSFTFEELQVLADLQEEALLLGLEEALAADVIRAVGRERYQFAQEILRYTLYGGLSPSRRVRLHRRMAEGLERTYAGRTSEVAAEIARQYHGSATLPGAEAGIPHAVTAIEQAQAAGEPMEAVTLAQIAIDLTPHDAPSAEADAISRLAIAQAEAALLDDALRSLRAALPLLEQAGKPSHATADLIYQVLARLRIALPRRREVEPLIARGIAALGDERSLAWARLKLLEWPSERLAEGVLHAVRWDRPDPDAVRIVREEGSGDDYLRTIDWFAALTEAEIDEIILRFDTLQNPQQKLAGLVSATHHLFLRQGVTSAVERLCSQSEALAEQLDSPAGKAVNQIQRAMMLGEQGLFDQAAATIAEVQALAGDQEGGELGPAGTMVGELTNQHVAPDWQRSAELTRELARDTEPLFWSVTCASFASHAFVRAGLPEEGRALLEEIVPVLVSGRLAPYAQSNGLSLAGAAVWELRERELAEQLLDYASTRDGAGDWYMASSELTIARMSTVLGRYEQSIEHFQRAREALSQRGQRPLSAIVDFDEAIARREGRQAGAARLLASAEAQFAELNMAEWSRRAAAEDMAGELPDQLTPREAEILRLLAKGLTNNEIAAELVLSVHTVERHLTNSYRKIAVRNRADATAYVLRTSL